MSNIVMKIPKVKLAMLNSPNPNGEKCIYIRVPFSDRYLKKSTNLWILPKDWDEKQQIVLPSNENYEVINNKLSLALAPIRSKILKLEPPIAICTIQEILGLKTTDGFLLYQKRLEKGSFEQPRLNPSTGYYE